MQALQILEQLARRSFAGDIHFGELVPALAELGVSAYLADYRTHTCTYYLAGDAAHAVAMPVSTVPIADAFDAEGVAQAVRGAQRGELQFPRFKALTREAGCVGYFVWIDGRQVQYLGRRGEVHVERFPER